MADGTETTEFIVGMVFFGIGVILLVLGIIAVTYFCIYRRRKQRFMKKHHSHTNNSIVYTKNRPHPGPLTISVPDNNEVFHGNGIQTLTTLSPLESPRTVYSLENGSTRAENFMLTTADGPKPHHHSLDTVDNNKYVLREVYKNTKSKKKISRAKSWDKKWSGSLLGGGKKKHGYHTERVLRPVYVQETYPEARGAKVYRSNPSLLRANHPTSVSSIPGGATYTTGDRRLFVVDDHNQQPFTTQSMILTRSPRSPRSQKFSAGSLDMSHEMNHSPKSHDLSHDFVDGGGSHHVHVDANYMRWSPTMKRNLDSRDRLHEKSDSEITSVSRNGRRQRGVSEHKYIYNKQDGTLKQF